MAPSRIDELLRVARSRDPAEVFSTDLIPSEIFWREHQVWLQEMGYMLRPRYHPNWVSSSGTGVDPGYFYEDSFQPLFPQIMDAKKIDTDEYVMIKKVSKSVHPYETEIHRYLTSGPLASHPRNHCAPLVDALELPDDPDIILLVTPLYRAFDDPRFETVGELVECFRQVFEGLQFMHQCHVAHRDCNSMNIMLDPRGLYPDIFHPQALVMDPSFTHLAKHYTRTKTPVKYYFIDFGISRRFNPEDGPPRELPIQGGDKSAPEILTCEGPIDPFPTDVYYLGNMIRVDILELTRGAEFMKPLMEEMVQEDPLKRPTMDEVVHKFDAIRRSLWWWQLRARLKHVEEDKEFGLGPWRDFKHFFRTAGNILKFRKAVPTPK